MQVISLSAIPNQSFTTTQDNDTYNIDILEVNGCMAANVTKNGTVVCTGQRLLNGTPMIPFKYLEGQSGNFCFLCSTEDCIYYTLFGTSQQLLYLSYSEMQAL